MVELSQKKLSEVDKQKVFAEDLATINSDEIRNFTLSVLQSFPWYFWTQPASTTGKYHPECTLGIGGLLVHTKRVLYFGKMLIRAHKLEVPSEQVDAIISAMILHDGQKGGIGYGSGGYEERERHPLLVRERYLEVMEGRNPDSPWWETVIWEMITHHMGPWSPEYIKKELKYYTDDEMIVYHADYLAAQKSLVTPVDGMIQAMNLEYSDD